MIALAMITKLALKHPYIIITVLVSFLFSCLNHNDDKAKVKEIQPDQNC